jgi:hypothetical protein
MKNAGITMSISYPRDCVIELSDRILVPSNAARTWDGKVSGSYTVGRSLTLNLDGLDSSLISKTDTFALFFDITKETPQVRRVLLSTDLNAWLTVPPPPMASDVGISGNSDEELQRLSVARANWTREMFARYGELNFPRFSVAEYFTNADLDSPAGIARIKANRTRVFLKLVTTSMRNPDRFIDAIKSVITKCGKA